MEKGAMRLIFGSVDLCHQALRLRPDKKTGHGGAKTFSSLRIPEKTENASPGRLH
jgi:hypothetical protein